MRHQYTPVFREFTTSSMWAKCPATRCVWLYMLLHADPEGFVPGTTPGLAVAANVSLKEARTAIAEFLAPDPDSNTKANKGRRIERVDHGWRILNFEYWRELAKAEAEKARKRRWAEANRKKPKQLALPFPPEFLPTDPDEEASTVDASSETLDAPKPKPKPSPSEGGSPLPPVAGFEETGGTIRVRRIVKDLDGWEPSDELRAAALTAGVIDFDERIKSLRAGPIGGQRGVFADELDNYISSFFGTWRTWGETARAKDAQRAAVAAPPRRFGAADVRVEPFEALPKHEAFARKHGLDLGGILQGVLADYPQSIPSFSRLGALGERLRVAAKQKQAGHEATGRLTRAESEAWGPVPPGGAIPDVDKGAA